MKSQFLLQALLIGLLQTAALADMPPPRPEPPDPPPPHASLLPHANNYATLLGGIFLASAGLLFGFSRKTRTQKATKDN
jgi:hypothetical protein